MPDWKPEIRRRLARLQLAPTRELDARCPARRPFAQHDVFIEGQNGPREVPSGLNTVGPRYFQTMEIRIVHGHEFTLQDRARAQPVVMINETLARRLWPGEDPIGKRLRVGGESVLEDEVIGVAADGMYATIGENARPYIDRPLLQSYATNDSG